MRLQAEAFFDHNMIHNIGAKLVSNRLEYCVSTNWSSAALLIGSHRASRYDLNYSWRTVLPESGSFV